MQTVNIRQLKNNPSTALARVADKPLAEMLTLLSSLELPLTGDGKAAADDGEKCYVPFFPCYQIRCTP
jgi:hypothetical protein